MRKNELKVRPSPLVCRLERAPGRGGLPARESSDAEVDAASSAGVAERERVCTAGLCFALTGVILGSRNMRPFG